MHHYILKNGCFLMQNITVFYGTLETKSLLLMEQNGSYSLEWNKHYLKILKFWGRITLYLWRKSYRCHFRNETATWSKLLRKSDIITEVQLKITIFTCLVKNIGAEWKIKIRCSLSKSPIFHYWGTVYNNYFRKTKKISTVSRKNKKPQQKPPVLFY